MLPLHKEVQNAQKGLTSHAGLWYDRFFNLYDADWQLSVDAKKNWIGKTSGGVGDTSMLKGYAARQKSLVDALGGISLEMASVWHFVTGMGNNHPVENGFAWHHTLGVPYLTGAAVKGMLRAWCETWAEGFDAGKIHQWFGDMEKAGELIFFDAVPPKPVKLKVDIMTPHYGKWYTEGETRPNEYDTIPADWHDPVPVPFLVMDKGQSFRFCVGKRPGSGVDLEGVGKALTDALQWIGAGAKTAAGYGRMHEDPIIQQQRKREAQEKNEAEQARLHAEAEKKAREEAERQKAEEAVRHQDELDAMPEHERVLAEASDAFESIRPRLATHKEAYGELRGVINRVLDAAAMWASDQRGEALDWVTDLLDEHGWRHPDINARKRKKWEQKTRRWLDGLRD